jgi:antitoxin HigA-1
VAIHALHPGEHLAEELEELCMSAAELARQLDVPTHRVTEIMNGRRAITGDTALRLAHFFGTTAEFWLNLQSLYELRIARQQHAEGGHGHRRADAHHNEPWEMRPKVEFKHHPSPEEHHYELREGQQRIVSDLPNSSEVMVTCELSTQSSVPLSASSSNAPAAPLAVKSRNITPIAAA